MEVNVSDDCSCDVVKNCICISLGIEFVKIVSNCKVVDGLVKVVKLVCVIVDEVDGVVLGFGGLGEGGFIKVLIDFVFID